MIENINLNIKKGTYEQLADHLDDIEDTDLLLGTDKDVPVPETTDAGKVIGVNASGEYELVVGGSPADNIIDIGAGQTTIEGIVYPTVSKTDADEIYLKYVSGQPITLLWGTTGIATHISVIYASDISGYEIHCLVHGRIAVFNWTDSTTGTITPTIKDEVSSVVGQTGDVTASQIISAVLTGNVNYGDKISSKGSNYITFASGLKICWDVTLLDAFPKTINLPITFTSSTSYRIVGQMYYESDSFDNVVANSQYIRSQSTTSFIIRKYYSENVFSLNWIAIGY